MISFHPYLKEIVQKSEIVGRLDMANYLILTYSFRISSDYLVFELKLKERPIGEQSNNTLRSDWDPDRKMDASNLFF